MMSSVPARAERTGPAPTAREAIVDAVSRATMRTLPHLPERLKRVLLGGRRVTVDGNTLDTTVQLLLAGQRMTGVDGLTASGDVAISRRDARKTAEMLHVDLPVEVTDLVIPGPAGPMRARHYRASESGAPLLIYFHGGGFVIADLDVFDDPCRAICRDGVVHVLSVDYRLAPEHKAPAAADDAYAAYLWALDHAAELRADPARIAVGGDSAGGNLAAVVCQRARTDGVRLPALQLLIYPMTNLSGQTRSQNLFASGYVLTKRDIEWFAHHYLDGASVEPTDPVVSPLLADDLSGLPPALVLTAGFDPLRDEGTQYAEAMQVAGVPVDLRQYDSVVHCFINFFPLGGGCGAAVADLISALRAHLSRA